MKRKKYSAEFKLKIIELVEKKGNKVSQIAEKYSIEISIIHRWINEYKISKTNGEILFPGNGKIKNIKNKIIEKDKIKMDNEKRIINEFKKQVKTKTSLNDYFEYINNNREKYTVIQMVEVLNINRSSYYKWVKRNK